MLFDGIDRPDPARRDRDRRTRHRPQIPEADGVREPDRRGQSAAGAQRRSQRRAARCSGAAAAAEAERIERVLETIRLTDARDRLAGSLSHGQKQWLEIGMLLAQDPKLLLVDEPVAGMTDVETHQTAELLQGDQQGQDGHRGRARHDLRARTRRQGHRACTKARCWPKARSIRSRRTSASSKCIWGDEAMRVANSEWRSCALIRHSLLAIARSRQRMLKSTTSTSTTARRRRCAASRSRPSPAR